MSVALSVALGRAFHGARLSEVGGEPRMAVLLLATAHRPSSRGLVGHRSWPLLTAFARPLASTSGIGFRKAGTVYAHRVSRAFRPSVEMGACHRDCARQIRADDPLAVSATGQKHPLGVA